MGEKNIAMGIIENSIYRVCLKSDERANITTQSQHENGIHAWRKRLGHKIRSISKDLCHMI